MENEEEPKTNLVNDNSEKDIENDNQNTDINNENKNVHLKSQITNNINNINIVNMIIEKDQRKLSTDSHESIKSNKTFSETKSKSKIEQKEGNNKIKNEYFLNNRSSFNKNDKPNKNSNYNLDISSIKELLNFQSKFIKNGNNIVETNKCLQAYASMHPEVKINPIYFYILKNYQKEHKLNQNFLDNDTDEKYTPRKNINDNMLENSNINTAETAKNHLNEKTKEIMELRKKITKIEEGNNLFLRNTINTTNYKEKENNSKLKFQRTSIQNKKTAKENLHFKNDEEVVNFVKKKFKEKNSYYLIELKNKSYITHFEEDDKSKVNEYNNSEINKLKSENKIIKSKNLKLVRDLEQIEKEMKLINEKNKELTEEINKKDSLIKKYEIKIKENRNQIQILKKNISENDSNNKEKDKNISTIKKEIELIILKNEKIKISDKGMNYNKLKTEKIFSVNYGNEELKTKFDDNLKIINIQKFDFFSCLKKDNKNNNSTNILEIKKENDIIIFQNKIETKHYKKNNNFEKIFVESLNILGIERKNNDNFNFMKENIINFKFENAKIKEINNEMSKKFINIEISKNFEINFKGLLKPEQNFEIFKNQNIFFEKAQKVQIKLFNNNLSKENIYNFNFEKVKKEKKSINETITFEHTQEMNFKGNKKIFEIKSLNVQKNQELQIKFTHNKNNIREILSIEKTNIIIFNELKKISELTIVKNEIIFLMKSNIEIKNILKIIKLDTISFKRTNNIINKFKNIEISKINISFCYKNTSQNILPKNNTNNTSKKIDKPEIDNKKQEISNNLNKSSNNETNAITTDKNTNNTKEIKPKENEQLDIKKKDKSDRLNRAMNRIKRKNQSKVESEILNSESLKEIANIRQKGRSDTVRYFLLI